jgi:chromosome segregation ATPase
LQIENLEDLLKEKDNQVDMARARLTAMQAHHCSSEGALSSLEEALGDKEKQMAQLREQRDRAERDKAEERELHERELAEFRMKLHAANSDIETLQARLDRALTDKEKLEAKLECSQSELGKSKAELDKVACDVGGRSGDWEATRTRLARLEIENERLRSELDRAERDRSHSPMLGMSSTSGLLSSAAATTGVMAVRGGAGGTSPSGPGGMAQELERLQERSDRNASELRRAQAELRLANSERDRLRTNADSLQVWKSKPLHLP